jgi:hypothetical protein
MFGIEKDSLARTGDLKLKAWIGTNFDPFGDAEVIADRLAVRRGEAWLA